MRVTGLTDKNTAKVFKHGLMGKDMKVAGLAINNKA